MSFLLSSHNIYIYLSAKELYRAGDFDPAGIELKPAKNFNLLLTLKSKQKLLVKQERHSKDGKTMGEFFHEWRIRELTSKFVELGAIRHLFPEILFFDAEHSIVVFNYLDEYRDLDEFYKKEKIFSIAVAREIGCEIAAIHRSTFQKTEYQDFLTATERNRDNSELENLVNLQVIDRVSPEVFGIFPSDCLKFLSLYQRYDSLGQAISTLNDSYKPCCLTHRDFKLNNILLHHDWEQRISKPQPDSILRLIDWERSGWGDPAFDLGSIVASYLQIWLGSLVVSPDTTLEESLHMATIPLGLLQPSLNMLIGSYLMNFPEILHEQPTFVQRVVQFAGLALIQQIEAMIQYQKVFNNTGICMLQVAKSFLCRPAQSIPTIFGQSEAELIGRYQPESIAI
ncbi:phosphotransferase [Chamaesiphon polymorphus]|uniref:LPS biosynthesis choline kinase n=1 Tax=Chamaesiphon polymorphus CCALA 037 TaxID=2107692 RepID=A0A2T1GKU1_9CYAN|nr:phosphotransferase [Chamaesiphon polymorphus]PSB58470.1 LPS biosynthesis choline kinase [Chamaesiphon polymorphus CCALA 037]